MTDDPALGALQDNGGETVTHALLEGSPAIDAASGECLAIDQRQVPRPSGSGCDIGAYEAFIPKSLDSLPPPSDPPITAIPFEPFVPTVLETAPCWLGPGAQYEVVSSVYEGEEVDLLGIGAIDGWLVINNPRYNVPCWVAEERVEVDPQLDWTNLVVFPVPILPTATSPVPQPSTPAAPKGLTSTTICASPIYNVNLSWKDKSNNESGFRVYRDGVLIATLGPNASQFTDTNPTNSSGHNYTVKAYNSVGESGAAAVSSAGCIF
jgi:hypothetical protein